ncbi:hypothetical protein AAG906_018715 [Vitis piasezkii]
MNGHGRDEQALKVTYDDKFAGRGGRGRGAFRGRGRGRGRQAFNKAIVECYKCHQLGHFQYECPKWEKGAHYAELDEKEEMLLMSYVELNQSRKEDVWFLDSGCSNHMCGNKLWFSDLDEEFRQSVKLGNNSKMTVLGKGNIRMQVAGVTQVITDVFYIPEVYHPEKGLIMQTSMSANRMFILPARVMPKAPTCFQITLEDNTHLWHCRYGHLSFKGLRTLQYKEMVRGLPQLKASSKVCTDCMVGKQHRDAIPKRSLWRASQRLQLVHADICGPIKPVSNSKKRYLISFIDDYSRKVWIYFLTEKSEAFTTFKNYKNLVEKETGAFICCLRIDRGGEFTSLEFNAFCKTNGISRQLTAAYTPQQNGVAERKNRTIMNMVRSMLSEKQVPKNFWPEAVNWTAHVLNRSPTLAVKGVTPEEAWSGVKPNVDYFRVFGCIGHVHVPDNKRKKLDDKSFQCVLLGCWNWGRSNEEVRLDVLEWGDSNEEGSEDEQGEDDAEEGVAVEGREREDSLSSKGDVEHNLVLFTSTADPTTFEEAVQSSKWRAAMDLEIEAIERNGTWELTDLPEGVKKIGVKWCKARLVAKGYAQQHGIDYTEVFAPVARWDTIRMGYEKKGEEHKQAPRAWYSRIEAYFIKEGFERCSCDHICEESHCSGDRLTKNEGGVKVDATKYKQLFLSEGNGELMAYTDSDYAGDVDDRKSTSGYVFLLSEGAVAWSSKKQPVVTLSTTEAEFVAAASCACQGVWMRRVLEKLGHSQGKCTTVLCDNSSTIKCQKSECMDAASTLIGVIELKHCGTQEQVADIMTKPLKLDVFLKLRELLGVSVVPRVN